MKTILTIILMFVFGCGKRDEGEVKQCLSRVQKMQQCFSQYNETHDRYYVERICAEKYPEEGCY